MNLKPIFLGVVASAIVLVGIKNFTHEGDIFAPAPVVETVPAPPPMRACGDYPKPVCNPVETVVPAPLPPKRPVLKAAAKCPSLPPKRPR